MSRMLQNKYFGHEKLNYKITEHATCLYMEANIHATKFSFNGLHNIYLREPPSNINSNHNMHTKVYNILQKLNNSQYLFYESCSSNF